MTVSHLPDSVTGTKSVVGGAVVVTGAWLGGYGDGDGGGGGDGSGDGGGGDGCGDGGGGDGGGLGDGDGGGGGASPGGLGGGGDGGLSTPMHTARRFCVHVREHHAPSSPAGALLTLSVSIVTQLS